MRRSRRWPRDPPLYTNERLVGRLLNLRPTLVSLLVVPLLVLGEHHVSFLVALQQQLVLVHEKIVGIDIFELPHGEGHRTIPAVLGSIPGRFLVEGFPVCARLEVVRGSAISALPLGISLYRLPFRKEGNRVVSVCSDTLRIDVHQGFGASWRLSPRINRGEGNHTDRYKN